MPMNLDRLYAILRDATVELRKGPERTDEIRHGIRVTHIWAMPHVDELQDRDDYTLVDVVFLWVAVHKAKAAAHRDDLMSILIDYPQPERLRNGPSYIEVGAVIGDQGAAFRLFALGEVLGLWKVITPAVLGITDPTKVQDLAGGGMVMMSGFKS
jgi:hypothetical protein